VSRRTTTQAFAAAFTALFTIAACGGDDADVPSQGTAVEGRTFLSASVVGHDLVSATRARLAFADGQLRASAGCNSLAAAYSIEDGRLIIGSGGMSMTEMGCEPTLHAQDAWLAELLTSSPSVALTGPELILSNSSVTMRLLDREVAEPDRPLVGTTWRVDTIFVGDTAASVAGGGEVTLRFDGASGFEVSAPGCTAARGSVEVGPRTLTFGDLVVDAIGCPAPWDATLAVLRGGPAEYTIDGDRLTVRALTTGIAAVAEAS
jgi:heat shock protein HslJ